MTLRWPVVLFDLDGTLANTVPLIVQSYQTAHREVLGTELDDATIRPWIGKSLRDVYGAWPDHTDTLIAAYRRFNLANLEALQQDYTGVPELLARLRDAGAVIGVVTSKTRPTAERSLAASGLSGAIEILAGEEDTIAHKPDPAPLLFALDKLGRRPEEACYVGDAAWDLAAARNAGVAGIGVTWGAGDADVLAAEAPVAVVDDPQRLGEVLGA